MRFLTAAVLLLFALPSLAFDSAGSRLVVPVVGRTAGVHGTQWQTDLVVAHLGGSSSNEVSLEYWANNAQTAVASAQLLIDPGATVTLRDVLPSVLNVQHGLGFLRINAADPNTELQAYARVYNLAADGREFGQTVPAAPSSSHGFHTDLVGLSGTNGSRSNVGITNVDPSLEMYVTLTLRDADGERVAEKNVEVVAAGVLQINDVFAFMGVPPLDSARLHVGSAWRVFTYASIVRNDTGDPTYIAGTETGGGLPEPDCADPAALIVRTEWMNSWIVGLRDAKAYPTLMPQLEAKYGFTPTHRYPSFGAFAAPLTNAQIRAMQCDPAIKYIEQSTFGTIP